MLKAFMRNTKANENKAKQFQNPNPVKIQWAFTVQWLPKHLNSCVDLWVLGNGRRLPGLVDAPSHHTTVLNRIGENGYYQLLSVTCLWGQLLLSGLDSCYLAQSTWGQDHCIMFPTQSFLDLCYWLSVGHLFIDDINISWHIKASPTMIALLINS